MLRFVYTQVVHVVVNKKWHFNCLYFPTSQAASRALDDRITTSKRLHFPGRLLEGSVRLTKAYTAVFQNKYARIKLILQTNLKCKCHYTVSLCYT